MIQRIRFGSMSYECLKATENHEICVMRIDARLCDGEQQWKNLVKLEFQKQSMLKYNKLELFFFDAVRLFWRLLHKSLFKDFVSYNLLNVMD